MNGNLEDARSRWDRRLRSFWMGGGGLFFACIIVARPLTESFEVMRWFIPAAAIALFSTLVVSGFAWLFLQIAFRDNRDSAARIRPRSFGVR